MSSGVARPGGRPAVTLGGRFLAVCLGTVVLLLAGCTAATETTEDAATISPPVSVTEGSSPSASASLITSEIIGYWHRAQTCAELVSAFEAAGLAQSHTGWLQGNFYGGGEGPTTGDLCAGADGPLEHSHWFTETGEFGSHDQAGEQVDNGDYTLSTPTRCPSRRIRRSSGSGATSSSTSPSTPGLQPSKSSSPRHATQHVRTPTRGLSLPSRPDLGRQGMSPSPPNSV